MRESVVSMEGKGMEIKPLFSIKPRDRKILKSSKVRNYFKHVEEMIAKKLCDEDIKFCPNCGVIMMDGKCLVSTRKSE